MVLSLLTVVIASFYDTARFNNNNDMTLYKLNRCIKYSLLCYIRAYIYRYTVILARPTYSLPSPRAGLRYCGALST